MAGLKVSNTFALRAADCEKRALRKGQPIEANGLPSLFRLPAAPRPSTVHFVFSVVVKSAAIRQPWARFTQRMLTRKWITSGFALSPIVSASGMWI